jgi:hypothetical protein
MWIAIPLAVWMAKGYKVIFLLWLGFSGMACIIEKILNNRKDHTQSPHLY